ncbi:hypothetical protein [Aggregatibacter kilianii]|uniref:hypothetical protein n=1 Tax=Aggregatibacter kilianii TaxID=2025884 RepID=UPI000D657EAB|nr:hypothetical protein [Aggregatibacter kilianii]
MNKIDISISYSHFKDIFTTFFYARINSGISSGALSAIKAAKEYWVLFDSELRSDITRIAMSAHHPKEAMEAANEFVKWTNRNQQATRSYKQPIPLTVLPVVDLKPHNGGKNDNRK